MCPSTQINLNKRSLVNPKSTSNQSSKNCTVAQYTSQRRAALTGHCEESGKWQIQRLRTIRWGTQTICWNKKRLYVYIRCINGEQGGIDYIIITKNSSLLVYSTHKLCDSLYLSLFHALVWAHSDAHTHIIPASVSHRVSLTPKTSSSSTSSGPRRTIILWLFPLLFRFGWSYAFISNTGVRKESWETRVCACVCVSERACSVCMIIYIIHIDWICGQMDGRLKESICSQLDAHPAPGTSPSPRCTNTCITSIQTGTQSRPFGYTWALYV